MAEQRQAKYVIVGGGVAAANTSVGIREVDADGSVVIAGLEKWYPYDRPPLSKGFLTKDLSPEDVESKDPSFYQDKNIQVLRGNAVKSIDLANRKVVLADGSNISYEKLLVATGSTPKKPSIPGMEQKGVHMLRTVDQSMAIKADMQSGQKAVMVGAGYIGMEVGSGCITKGMETTIVDPSAHPWSKFASNVTGNFLRDYYTKHGANMMMGEEVEAILGDGTVRSVRLKSGTEVDADLVVVGIGVTQNLHVPKQAGLQMDEKHGVLADDHLRTSDPNVYVAGDIAAFEDRMVGRRWHAEHFLHAQWTGKQAGRNMAGANEPYIKVPYFFSDMLDFGMVLRGDPQGGKSQKVFGDLEAVEFVELYGRPDGTLCMGMGFSKDSKRQDFYSDRLEELVKANAKIEGLDKKTFDL